jgi:hypothetical protein
VHVVVETSRTRRSDPAEPATNATSSRSAKSRPRRSLIRRALLGTVCAESVTAQAAMSLHWIRGRLSGMGHVGPGHERP